MDEINESHYSEFLEQALRYIYEHKPKAITLVAESHGDEGVMTAYSHAEPQNKMTAIQMILTDFIMETIVNNREYLRALLDQSGDEVA